MKSIAYSFLTAAALLAGSALAATPAAVAKPDLAKGEAMYTAMCASCHGADGNSGSPANPKLAQQHPEYLVKQLQEFKSGKRANPVMGGMAAGLGDEDMRNMAFWLSAKTAKPGFAKDRANVALGERIYRGGIAERQVAACASCHSPNGAGLPAQYPRLAGQHADYAAAQLVAFREHANQDKTAKPTGRANNGVMSAVAAKLNDREIKAVADYMAGLN